MDSLLHRQCEGRQARYIQAPSASSLYRGYKGIVFRRKDGKILNRGYFEMKGTSCHIYDIPITMSGKKYQKHLDKMVEDKKIQDYKATSVDSNRPSFVLRGCEKEYKRHRDLGIEQVIGETNMVFMDENNVPHHYHMVLLM